MYPTIALPSTGIRVKIGARQAEDMAIKTVDSEEKEPKLLSRIREAARVRHLSLRTEKAYA